MNKVRLFQLAFWFMPKVPHRLSQYAAIGAGYVAWLIAQRTRARVRANLAHVPTLAANPQRLNRATRQAFAHLMLNYVDLFAPPDLTDPDFPLHFPIEEKDLIRDIMAQGKGCIMVTHHVGTFELAKYRLRLLLDTPVIVPVEAVDPPGLFALLVHERSRCGMDFRSITESETLRDMLLALRQGQAILVAMDRDVLHTGVMMPFLGAPARLPIGVIALARRTGAPIVWVSAVREDLRRYHGRMTLLAADIDSETRGDDAVRHALAPIVAHMEALIMQHPEQWLAAFADDVWQETRLSSLPVRYEQV
jgi:lauroyl/myristoyl acyltransferase